MPFLLNSRVELGIGLVAGCLLDLTMVCVGTELVMNSIGSSKSDVWCRGAAFGCWFFRGTSFNGLGICVSTNSMVSSGSCGDWAAPRGAAPENLMISIESSKVAAQLVCATGDEERIIISGSSSSSTSHAML